MMEAAGYPAIPPAIWSYYTRLLEATLAHPLVETVRNQGEDQTWRAINALFHITATNTRLAPEKLLSQLGFDENNLDNNHLQSIFGVMRAINMLHDLGFANITPLPARRSRRECDLLAEYQGARLAIEVFRSSEAVYRFPGHHDPVHDLQSYIAGRYQAKRTQLEATMKAHNCSKSLLVVVMDSPPAKQLTRSDEWQGIAKQAFMSMGSPGDVHLLMFTGNKDESTGKDEHVIHPLLT